MKRRILLAAALAAAAAVVVSLLWPRGNQLVLTGIVSTDEVIVSSEIEGRLEHLYVKEGDTVNAGQTVAELQPPEYAADVAYYQSAANQAKAQIVQAQADYHFTQAQTAAQIAQAQANLAAAKAQEAAAAADEENARLAYQRARTLRAQQTISAADYDQARTAEDGARARLGAARQQTDAAAAAVRVAQASADEVAARQAAVKAAADSARAAAAEADKARVRLGYTEVQAPIAGIVDVRAARQGEVVNPGQAIVTLINPDDLWVRADVEETYVDQIRLGEKVWVRLPSGDRRQGTIFYRAVDADFATQRDVSRSKRDIRTFELRVRCDNRDRALAVGMTAYVLLPLRAR